jgi:hypothetical protein
MTMRLCRYLWAAPCSAVGLLLAAVALALGARARLHSGVLEVALPRITRGPVGRFGAITFGHVVLGRSEEGLARCRTHERVHVMQYERWGLLFFLAYPASSFAQLLRGRNPYWYNYFEIEARERCAQLHVIAQAKNPAAAGS